EDDYCFAKEGEVYAIYLKKGGSTKLDLGANTGPFNVRWYNPRAGGDLVNGTITRIKGPGKVSIGKSKSDSEKDWVVLIRK
ncbi:MAG: putative collagen-binding domain-containing protein, partial [Planctomycetota bacterium]